MCTCPYLMQLQCSWQDVLHAVAGLCSVALPDMEETAIYSSLTRSGSKTIVLFTGERSHSSRATDASTSTTVTAVTEQTRSVRVSGSVPVNVEPGECRRGTDCSACSSERSKPPQCAASAASEGGSNEEDNEVSFNEIFSSSEASDTDRYIHVIITVYCVNPLSLYSPLHSLSLSLSLSLGLQCGRRG